MTVSPHPQAKSQRFAGQGGVGTGKTFAAACIANALTEQGVPVLMTNFSKILNSFSGRNYRTENAADTKNAIREIFTVEDSL